jgi:hypothetical protein
MMIDPDEAQECYTQQDSNFNGLFYCKSKNRLDLRDFMWRCGTGSASDLVFDESGARRGQDASLRYCTARQFSNKKGKAAFSLASQTSRERRNYWLGGFVDDDSPSLRRNVGFSAGAFCS